MAPVRRYLRITKWSVLECRIYLDNPALANSWLLNPRDPVLPRVVESVRPYVLPKLREERERRNRRGVAKKRAIKDVVVQDDFEVSIFLTDTATRHSLLKKHKHFREKVPRIKSTSNKLLGAALDAPIDVEELSDHEPPLRIEDDDEGGNLLHNIPDAPQAPTRRSKRQRSGPALSTNDDPHEIDSDDNDYVEGSANEEDSLSDSDTNSQPPNKRPRHREESNLIDLENESETPHLPNATQDDPEDPDDKKKLALDVSYQGFAIYGLVLCLVVKRRDKPASAAPATGRADKSAESAKPSGQAVMENWISSTQIPPDEVET